jgi:hypothetical protein
MYADASAVSDVPDAAAVVGVVVPVPDVVLVVVVPALPDDPHAARITAGITSSKPIHRERYLDKCFVLEVLAVILMQLLPVNESITGLDCPRRRGPDLLFASFFESDSAPRPPHAELLPLSQERFLVSVPPVPR